MRIDDTMDAKSISKGLISAGASIHRQKKVMLANFGTVPGGVMSVYSAKFGGVGEKMHLMPGEWEDEFSATYDEAGAMSKLQRSNVTIEGTSLATVVKSWNAYKKHDAWMCFVGDDNKIACSFPRVRVEKAEAEVGVKGTKVSVSTWRVGQLHSSSLHYTDPEMLAGFLKLDMVSVTDFTRTAMLVEDAVVKGGYVQIDPAEFANVKDIITMAQDTSIYAEKREVANYLMGLHLKDSSTEEKIKGFTQTPSVAFAVAAGLKQILTSPVINVSTKTDVAKVKLVDLADGADVLMNKVVISQDYWNNFTDISTVEVFKSGGNLAMKKAKKQQTTAQKFETEKAVNVKTILTAICQYNTTSKTKAPTAMAVSAPDAIDDDLLDS
jgi:hypothetical protein